MFPYVQQKYGQCQHEDKKLFCLSAKTFYDNLDSGQKQSFVKAVKDVAEPKTPYLDVLVAHPTVVSASPSSSVGAGPESWWGGAKTLGTSAMPVRRLAVYLAQGAGPECRWVGAQV